MFKTRSQAYKAYLKLISTHGFRHSKRLIYPRGTKAEIEKAITRLRKSKRYKKNTASNVQELIDDEIKIIRHKNISRSVAKTFRQIYEKNNKKYNLTEIAYRIDLENNTKGWGEHFDIIFKNFEADKNPDSNDIVRFCELFPPKMLAW